MVREFELCTIKAWHARFDSCQVAVKAGVPGVRQIVLPDGALAPRTTHNQFETVLPPWVAILSSGEENNKLSVYRVCCSRGN
jgi:hypothetical protein